MQGMDCRNFKELLDSYLSGELAVETNHACLRHAEQCPPCRAELGARRNLRSALRQACQQTTLSAEAQARLRACLRAEGAVIESSAPFRRRSFPWLAWFSPRWAFPVAAALLLAVGWLSWSALSGRGVLNATLSSTVFAEAAGDHRTCASHFADKQVAAITPGWMKEKFPAYAELAEVAAAGAAGLELKSVHVCKYQQRQFGHLVYGQNGKLISLLVTPRDGTCLTTGQLPADDGHTAGLQHGSSAACQISAYQTAKYVVFVVSELPETENEQLAARLAAPVSQHLRQVEKSIAGSWPVEPVMMVAALRRQIE
jgi:hypothetical protein